MLHCKSVEQIEICCENVESGLYIYTLIKNVFAPEQSKVILSDGCCLENLKLYNATSRLLLNLHFENSSVYEFPSDLFDDNMFYFLQTIKMNDCGLTSIKQRAFYHTSHLYELDLKRNNLTTLGTNLFIHFENLKKLDLSVNRIYEIHDFEHLDKLDQLLLKRNMIKKLESDIFRPLISVSVIDLSYNEIEVIEADLFHHNNLLKVINFENNHIMIIEPNTFSNLSQLKILKLSSNRMKEFDLTKILVNKIYLNHNDLRRLQLPAKEVTLVSATNNNIKEVVCQNTTMLSYLYLEGNNLTKLGCIDKIEKLVELDVSFNKIESLSDDVFHKLKSLQKLDLDFNNIREANLRILQYTNNLTHLDISYNRLEKFNLNASVNLRNMQYLFIDGNNLTELHHNIIRLLFPSLVRIGIYDNNFNCTYLMKMLEEFKLNGIEYLRPDKTLLSDQLNVDGITCANESFGRKTWKNPVKHVIMQSGGDSPNEDSIQIVEFAAEIKELTEKVEKLEILELGLVRSNIEMKDFLKNFTTHYTLPTPARSLDILNLILIVIIIIIISSFFIKYVRHKKNVLNQNIRRISDDLLDDQLLENEL